jgi:hypothetical protein
MRLPTDLAACLRVVKGDSLYQFMAELPDVTPEYFEILVVRELRKAGLEVGEPRVHRRTELPEPERGFLLELLVWLRRDTWQKRALIACRRQVSTIRAEAINSLPPHLEEARAEMGLLFATAAFTPQALAAGDEAGIALLQLVDARTAFDTSGWGGGGPGHYPAWLPAYLVQLVDRDPGGQPRARLLEAGQANIILERLRARGGVP